MAYGLPTFVSGTLAAQPTAPRTIRVSAVAGAVVAGVDCTIYAVGFLALICLSVLVQLWPSSPSASDARVVLIIQGIGVLFGLLAAFRIWQVYVALRYGD